MRTLSFILFGSVAAFASVANGDCFLCPAPVDATGAPLIGGNGGLTVAVDASGRIVVCRWPGPGDANQIRRTSYESTDGRGCGLAWGIPLPERVLWLGADPQKVTQHYADDAPAIIETKFKLPGTTVAVSQRVFVCPERDVLVAHLVLRNAGKIERVYWSADISPCTRKVPEWPAMNDAFSSLNGFAAYTPDLGKTMIHFRPRNPGSEDWSKAEDLARSTADRVASEWSSFGEGVWIAYGSPNEVIGFQCGANETGATASAQAGTQDLAGSTSSVGPCDSALALKPKRTGPNATATIIVAFGKDYGTAVGNLNAALERGYGKLAADTDAYWEKRLSAASMPQVDDASLLGVCKRDLLTLLQCMDRRSGAVIRWPAGSSWSTLDWVRDGAWTTLALDMAGYADLAERHTLFYSGAFRKDGKLGKPYGSLPAALYADGAEGAPHVVLDADAVAWTLGSFWRHASLLEDPARRSYLIKMWDRLTCAADFLVAWTDGRTRQPLYSFDYAACRDGSSPGRLLATYMGMDGALRIAETIGNPPPEEWKRRKRDLDALIRFQCVDKAGMWKSESVLPFWQPEVTKTELPPWENVIERRLNEAERSDSISISTLCDAALAWQDRPDKLARLKPHFTGFTIPLPDAVGAAQHFVAASLVYAPPREPKR